jgi:hypothetical protein
VSTFPVRMDVPQMYSLYFCLLLFSIGGGALFMLYLLCIFFVVGVFCFYNDVYLHMYYPCSQYHICIYVMAYSK